MKTTLQIILIPACMLTALFFGWLAWDFIAPPRPGGVAAWDILASLSFLLVGLIFVILAISFFYDLVRVDVKSKMKILGPMIENEVQVPTHNATLAGTLILREDRDDFPICLMIHGSGPLDRDENVPVQKLNVFNTIAAALAVADIASLRYDKRGCGRSTGNHLRASHADTVEDAAACIDYLIKAGYDQSRIVLLGHSEGTIIAAQLAPRYPGLMGIVLLCPFVQPLEQILLNQAEHMAEAARDLKGIQGIITRAIFAIGGGAVAGQRRLIAKLKSTDAPTIRFLFRRLPAASLRGLMALDPPAIYAKVQCDTLIIAGEKDIQCDPQDVAEIERQIDAEVESHILPDLTHILRRDPNPPNIFHYTKIMKDPLDEEVLQHITNWFTTRTGTQELTG